MAVFKPGTVVHDLFLLIPFVISILGTSHYGGELFQYFNSSHYFPAIPAFSLTFFYIKNVLWSLAVLLLAVPIFVSLILIIFAVICILSLVIFNCLGLIELPAQED